MTTNNSKTLANHDSLFNHPRCSNTGSSLLTLLQANQYDEARQYLKRRYGKYFDITDADWQFLEALATVRSGMEKNIIFTHGDGPEQDYIFTHLLKGHGPIRDLYGANVEQLLEAGLLRQPRIWGEQRRRIIHKPYYVLTPAATDCIETGTVGPGIGDLGESVTHAVGARLYGEYIKQWVRDKTGDSTTITYYDDAILDDHDIDIAVRTYPPGQRHKQQLYAVGEVKTVLSSDEEALNSLRKLGAVRCEHKHWIAPRRELINRIVNVAALRGWYTMDQVPETLALETAPDSGIRSTNDRIAASEYVPRDLGMPQSTPLTAGYSYAMLYREVKQAKPTMFDQPVVGTARH